MHTEGTARGSKLAQWCRKAGVTLLAGLWVLLTLLIIWPVAGGQGGAPSRVGSTGSASADYLVIAPQGLANSAAAWVQYRNSTGYQAQGVLLAPDQVTAETIRDVIHKTYAESGGSRPLYVLLMGHAHPDSPHAGAFLPAAHFTVEPDQFSGWGADPLASDDGLADLSAAGIPRNSLPILIGRIPVRTEAEGFLLLARTRSYEETPPRGAGRFQIELIASNAGFGKQYDPVFEWALRTLVQTALPDEYKWHLLYGNPQSPYSYPPALFANEFARRLDSRSLAVVYAGHGQPELLGWAYSQDGERGKVFGFEHAALIQDADASIVIITACSAGTYDLAGDELSVVESIFLAPSGPVGTYSSSAWINPTLNARLLLDIFQALLEDSPRTLGEWAYRVEAGSNPVQGRTPLIGMLKGVIARFSSNYEGKSLLSAARASQALDIQNATYNLFGDPALKIAHPLKTLEISPAGPWQPSKRALAFSGKGNLAEGLRVSISLEALPGEEWSGAAPALGTPERYHEANDPVVAAVDASIGPGGDFSGDLDLPPGLPSGKYLLRAFSVQGENTYIGAKPVYIGWPPIAEILSSTVFWWVLVGVTLLSIVVRRR